MSLPLMNLSFFYLHSLHFPQLPCTFALTASRALLHMGCGFTWCRSQYFFKKCIINEISLILLGNSKHFISVWHFWTSSLKMGLLVVQITKIYKKGFQTQLEPGASVIGLKSFSTSWFHFISLLDFFRWWLSSHTHSRHVGLDDQ